MFKKMYPDDLASLEVVDEEKVLLTLGNRYSRGQFQTYAGTVLLVINPQNEAKVYEPEVNIGIFVSIPNHIIICTIISFNYRFDYIVSCALHV